MFNELVKALEQAEKSFDPDELAFLALTSKIEAPFRDRFAYALSKQAAASSGRIAREYKRADIAWLVGAKPVAIIELKACYTRDLVTQPDAYFGYVLSDLRKAAGSGATCFAILLAAHPRSAIGRDIYDTVKYAGKTNAVIKHLGSAETVRERAEEEVRKRLPTFGQSHSFCWNLGAYLGIQVDLLGWLIEAPLLK